MSELLRIDKGSEFRRKSKAKLAAAEKLAEALRILARNKFSDENCESVALAGRRVAHIAREALAEWEEAQ